MSDIIIHLFEAPQDIFEKIFSKKGKIIEKNYGKIETKSFEKKSGFLKRKEGFNWIGKKYPKLLDNNLNNIFEDLIESIKQSTNKKNIIIIFGNIYLKPFRKMINAIDIDHPFVLFNFSEKDKVENDFFDKFKFPQFVSYIKDKYDEQNPDLNLHKIWSFIWEKDCYYNERGNVECNYSPANLLYKPSKGFIFCNVLLLGESRAGKSTFINRMFNKYVTYETGKYESATQEITYYEFSFPDIQEEKENNKLIKNGYGLIRILDSPGLVLTKDLDASSKIIDKLYKEIDNIHMIYFFLKGQSNLEQCIEILKYLNKKNIEREKNNNYKIPIIFIKNGEDLEIDGNGQHFFQELKKVLTKSDLMNLYDPSRNENNVEKKEINFFDEEDEEDILKDYQNYIDGNLIQIHLPSGKNLNKVFLKSKEYLLKNNELILEGKMDNEFNVMRKNAISLIKLYIKEKLEKKSLSKDEKGLYNKLYKECNEFSLELQKKGSILYNLDILKVKKDRSILWYYGVIFIVYFIYIIPLALGILCMIHYKKNLISKIASNFGFSDEDLKLYGLDRYVYSDKFLKELLNNKEESNKKIEEFFKNIIYYIGPIQCALKTRDALFQINELFEKLSKKKDEEWSKFKVEKI